METDIRTRPAQGVDLAAIARFDVHPGDRARELVERRLLVAELGGPALGYVSYLLNGLIERHLLAYLCVDPAHRRRGIAVALLRAAEDRVGPGRLFTSTEDDNHAMLTLLPREGWMRAGTISGINDDGREEVFFRKEL